MPTNQPWESRAAICCSRGIRIMHSEQQVSALATHTRTHAHTRAHTHARREAHRIFGWFWFFVYISRSMLSQYESATNKTMGLFVPLFAFTANK